MDGASSTDNAMRADDILSGLGSAMVDTLTCRCHLPLTTPPGRHWRPENDREPDTAVRVVACYGQSPAMLHLVRVPGGWHTRGVAANHTDVSPPVPWSRTGNCWAGRRHPVVDVTDLIGH